MQVEIKIDHSCVEPRVLIRTAAMTDEVRSIVNRLSGQPSRILSGSREEKVEVLQPEDLIRVYSNAGKVYAVTEKGEYTVRFRLYETEDEMTRYAEYLGKDGVFYEESPQAARKVIYPGKKYTGYSIAYLQEYFYEAAKKESCEKLMDLLDSVGFQGDITNISYLSADGDFPDAYEEGYRLLVADETGAEYFIAGAQWEKGVCVQPLKIADTGMRVLYEEAL